MGARHNCADGWRRGTFLRTSGLCGGLLWPPADGDPDLLVEGCLFSTETTSISSSSSCSSSESLLVVGGVSSWSTRGSGLARGEDSLEESRESEDGEKALESGEAQGLGELLSCSG